MNTDHPEVCSRTWYRFEEPEGHCEISACAQQTTPQSVLDEEDLSSPEPKTGFWRRQFQAGVTRGQKKFDWLFGVFLPLACFFFDPIVFRGAHPGSAFFGAYKPFAYLLAFASIMGTAAWLLWGKRLGWLNGFVSGLLAVSFAVSLSIGIVLLPFSIFGLAIIIGLLGFTPLFTSFVHLRNAVRAYRAAGDTLTKADLTRALVLGALVSAVVPFIANVEIDRSVRTLITGDTATINREARKLRLVGPLVDLDPVVLNYSRSRLADPGAERVKAISEFYKDMTGVPLEGAGYEIFD